MISIKLWQSQKFNSLSNDFEKLFYVYTHTCQHRNAAGCYTLPIAYAASDLKKTHEEIIAAIKGCEAARLIIYDWQENLIRIRNFFALNTIKNSKHALGAVRFALDLSDSICKLEVLQDLLMQKPVISDTGLSSKVKIALSNLEAIYPSDTSIEPVSNTDTETDTETKTKTEKETFTPTLAQQSSARDSHLNTNWMK